MKSFKTTVAFTVIAVAAAVFIAGCQSIGGDGVAVSDGTSAVHCAKCQVTWVQKPETTGGGRTTTYRTEKSMVCADCESAATSFFKTGKLEHTCKSCGGTPTHCVVHAGKPVTTSASAEEQVVTCPKCETTWVKERQVVSGGRSTSNTYVIRSTKKMTCPDCETAAANFFATGKLAHTCKSCGVDMKACEKHAH